MHVDKLRLLHDGAYVDELFMSYSKLYAQLDSIDAIDELDILNLTGYPNLQDKFTTLLNKTDCINFFPDQLRGIFPQLAVKFTKMLLDD